MKNLFLSLCLAFVFAPTSYAKTIALSVDDTFCGEYDPFIVGDTCILYMTKPPLRKLAVLFDFDVMSNRSIPSASDKNLIYEVDELTGKVITMDSSTLEKIDSAEVIAELKSGRSEYFYMRSIDDGASVKVVQ